MEYLDRMNYAYQGLSETYGAAIFTPPQVVDEMNPTVQLYQSARECSPLVKKVVALAHGVKGASPFALFSGCFFKATIDEEDWSFLGTAYLVFAVGAACFGFYIGKRVYHIALSNQNYFLLEIDKARQQESDYSSSASIENDF